MLPPVRGPLQKKTLVRQTWQRLSKNNGSRNPFVGRCGWRMWDRSSTPNATWRGAHRASRRSTLRPVTTSPRRAAARPALPICAQFAGNATDPWETASPSTSTRLRLPQPRTTPHRLLSLHPQFRRRICRIHPCHPCHPCHPPRCRASVENVAF